MKNISFYYLFAFSMLQNIYGQQEWAFNQYMFNHQFFNPAYSGSKNESIVSIISKNQWINIDGAPRTRAVSYVSGLNKKNLAYSISGINDLIGPINNLNTSLDIAYQLKLNDSNNFLGVGLKLSIDNLNFDYNALTFQTPNDPSLTFNNEINGFHTNIGFGLYFNSLKYYLGYSIPRMIEIKDFFYLKNHYVIAGGLLRLSDKNEIKPSLLLKFQEKSPISFDLSILYYRNRSFWVGPQLKNFTNQNGLKDYFNISFLSGIHISNNLSVGYSYSNMINFNSAIGSSHEILLRFELKQKKLGIIRSPRIF